MTQRKDISSFLNAKKFAVAGASTKRHKYGNKVLRCYLEHNYDVIPVNPGADEVEGIACAGSIADLPGCRSPLHHNGAGGNPGGGKTGH